MEQEVTLEVLEALEALEANVVEACANVYRGYLTACVSIGTDYFVKFGDPGTLWPEHQTQSYIFDYAMSNPHPDAPRIPQVVHYFRNRWTAYLVMEFITLTAPPPDLIDRTTQALVWLSNVPPPPNHAIGPLGGGRIRHRFFDDYEAPLLFSSVDALQRYMDRVRLSFIFSSSHASFTKMHI